MADYPLKHGAGYVPQPTKTFSNAALGTTEVTMFEVGSLSGNEHHRVDALNLDVAALGTGTTTTKFRLYAEVNGVSTLIASADRTTMGGFSLGSWTAGGHFPHTSRYLKVTVQRNEGTGTDGSVSGSFESSKAVA